MATAKSELDLLKKWLAKDGNSFAYLAGKLGYRSDAAVRKWIARGHIPVRARAGLMKIIKGDS